ncbi:lebercilin-like protein isoform X2 [Oxyura jamaicensis]|uniref:lebercilin-like protein isoform X2 n=1 Tax=Oxyura jamaicensis TaxID=8884 RepID=UPI0015A5FE3D|nr:lebercilin-like protein isoform X2 [Oxyura jamaicensis]
MWQRSQGHVIPQSTEVSEAPAVAEVMIVRDAVENTEAEVLTLTILRALSMTCSETAGSSDCLELSGTEEKKTAKDEKKKKKKKGQHNFSQNGGNKLPAKKKANQNPSFLSLQNNLISQKKNTVAQRILSARLHKIKELKNEIFDLQQKLRASNLENQVLKQLQWRHLKAIGGYENSESVLPDLLARHCSEVRALRKHLRMSQKEERSTSRKLRKVEAELLKTKDALQALHLLSEDEALAEREELDHRLSVLTEKMEVNKKRIQSLEKQLKLNNSTFSRQLAEESKKAVEAGIITENLQMEISTLHQKIKEKDRQLYVKNIYANRMPKIPKDRGDSVPHEKSLSRNASVQVEKQSFRSLLLPQHQTQETEKSPILLSEVKKPSEDKNQKANEAYTDAQHKTKKQSAKKIPKPEPSNRTHREYLEEDKPLTEEHTCLEFMKQEERKRDFLKEELKKMIKTEETPLTDSVKENSHEQDAVEEYEKEKKLDEQLSSSGKAGSKFVTPGPRNKSPTRLKKQYMFSEATENLHHGIPTSGTKPRKCSHCNHRHARQDCSEGVESKVKNSFGLYEPSFGKATKTRQRGSSAEAEGCAHKTFTERKKSLMKELFGPSCV